MTFYSKNIIYGIFWAKNISKEPWRQLRLDVSNVNSSETAIYNLKASLF